MPTLSNLSNRRIWLRGLVGAIIGGGANAVTLCITDPQNYNLYEGFTKLSHFTVVSAVVSAALYLKQQPIPPDEKIS